MTNTEKQRQLHQRASEFLDDYFELETGARAQALADLEREDSQLHQYILANFDLDIIDGEDDPDIGIHLPQSPRDKTGEWIEDYHLTERIAATNLSEVYLAETKRAPRLQHVIKLAVHPAFELLLKREYDFIVDHYHHRNIVDPIEFNSEYPFLVTRFEKGPTLGDYCLKEKTSQKRIIQLFAELCDAVAAVHDQNCIHRDLKPNNVLVAMQDGKPRPVLLDFGIAASTLLDCPALIEDMMTPRYAAPECRRGKMANVQSEVYSLGTVLAYMLTGTHHNWEATHIASTPTTVTAPAEDTPQHTAGNEASDDTNNEIPLDERTTKQADTTEQRLEGTTRQQTPGKKCLPDDLEAVILHSLQFKPELRYASVREFARDLRCVLEHRPISLWSQRLGYRASCFVKRNPKLVALSMLTLLLLSGFIIFHRISAGTWNRAARCRVQSLQMVNHLESNARETFDIPRDPDDEDRVRRRLRKLGVDYQILLDHLDRGDHVCGVFIKAMEGRAHMAMDQPEQALTALETAWREEPEIQGLGKQLVWNLIHLHDQSLREALYPDTYIRHVHLEQARSYLTRAREIHGQTSLNWNGRERHYLEKLFAWSADPDPSHAGQLIEDIKQVIEKDPEAAHFIRLLVQIQVWTGLQLTRQQGEEALAAFMEAAAQQEKICRRYYYRAQNHLDMAWLYLAAARSVNDERSAKLARLGLEAVDKASMMTEEFRIDPELEMLRARLYGLIADREPGEAVKLRADAFLAARMALKRVDDESWSNRILVTYITAVLDWAKALPVQQATIELRKAVALAEEHRESAQFDLAVITAQAKRQLASRAYLPTAEKIALLNEAVLDYQEAYRLQPPMANGRKHKKPLEKQILMYQEMIIHLLRKNEDVAPYMEKARAIYLQFPENYVARIRFAENLIFIADHQIDRGRPIADASSTLGLIEETIEQNPNSSYPRAALADFYRLAAMEAWHRGRDGEQLLASAEAAAESIKNPAVKAFALGRIGLVRVYLADRQDLDSARDGATNQLDFQWLSDDKDHVAIVQAWIHLAHAESKTRGDRDKRVVEHLPYLVDPPLSAIHESHDKQLEIRYLLTWRMFLTELYGQTERAEEERTGLRRGLQHLVARDYGPGLILAARWCAREAEAGRLDRAFLMEVRRALSDMVQPDSLPLFRAWHAKLHLIGPNDGNRPRHRTQLDLVKAENPRIQVD